MDESFLTSTCLLSVARKHILPIVLSELREGELRHRTAVQAIIERSQLLLSREIHAL